MLRNAGNRDSGDDRIHLLAVTPAASASATPRSRRSQAPDDWFATRLSGLGGVVRVV
jgi:hypothetical protein